MKGISALLSRLATATLLASLLVAAPTFGRGPAEEGEPSPPVLKFQVSSDPSPLLAPGVGRLLLKITVPSGYHIFSGEGLSVKVRLPEGAKAGAVLYPKGTKEEDFEVLRQSVVVEIPISLDKAAPKNIDGAILVDWQGCQDFGQKVCFLPTTDTVKFSVSTREAKEVGALTQTAARQETTPAKPEAVQKSAEPASMAQALPEADFLEIGRFAGFKNTGDFKSWLRAALSDKSQGEGVEAKFARAARENVPLALLMAFIFGVLSSLTPCVYPVIPITVAYIGSRSQGKKRSHGFLLSLCFVLGLAVVYALLGAISAKAGAAFGSLTQNRWIGLGVAALFYALALSMFNLFELRTPSALANRLEMSKQKGKGRGFVGAFFIGAVSGLVASPCIGPLILAILVVVASTGSVLLGFLYLFVFALGMGLLFVVIGTFSGILSAMPKSGGWMDGVRIFFGVLILAAAFYFAGLYLPRNAFFIIGGAALCAVVMYLLFGAKRHFFSVPARIAAIALCLASFAAVLPTLPESGKAENGQAAWRSDMAAAFSEARASGKPVLMDFRADWCVACVELEKKTWPSAEVQEALKGLVPLRMDMTQNNEANRALQARFQVKGLPTVILLLPPPKKR
jgi:thiol:disulfide interchange protein DsbD